MTLPKGWRLHFTAFGTLLVAAILTVLPVPEWLAPWQPHWVPITLMFWLLTRPGEIGFGMAWIFGLLSDALAGSWFGTHVISYCLLVFLCARFYQSLRFTDFLQKLFPAALLLSLHLAYLQLMSIAFFKTNPGLSLWSSGLASLIIWPLLFPILTTFQRWMLHKH